MLSFIDDIPSRAQIEAGVKTGIKKYKIDERVRRSRIIQTAKRLAADEQLKIDPITWIWQRTPTRAEAADFRVVRFARRHRVAIAGFCAGAAVMLLVNAIVIAGNFGGLSDNVTSPTFVYPAL